MKCSAISNDRLPGNVTPKVDTTSSLAMRPVTVATVAARCRSQGSEDEGNCLADGGQQGIVVVGYHAKAVRSEAKSLEEPEMMELSRMTVPARLMKDQPRSQVARRTLPRVGT